MMSRCPNYGAGEASDCRSTTFEGSCMSVTSRNRFGGDEFGVSPAKAFSGPIA